MEAKTLTGNASHQKTQPNDVNEFSGFQFQNLIPMNGANTALPFSVQGCCQQCRSYFGGYACYVQWEMCHLKKRHYLHDQKYFKILEKCFRAQNDGVSKQYRVFLGRRQSHASSRVPEKVYSLIEDLCDWQRDCQTSDVTPHLFLKLVQFPLTHKTTVPSTNKQIDAVDRWTDTYMDQGRHQDSAPGITVGEDYSRDIISLKSWA